MDRDLADRVSKPIRERGTVDTIGSNEESSFRRARVALGARRYGKNGGASWACRRLRRVHDAILEFAHRGAEKRRLLFSFAPGDAARFRLDHLRRQSRSAARYGDSSKRALRREGPR
jgi:hypothetical protein